MNSREKPRQPHSCTPHCNTTTSCTMCGLARSPSHIPEALFNIPKHYLSNTRMHAVLSPRTRVSTVAPPCNKTNLLTLTGPTRRCKPIMRALPLVSKYRMCTLSGLHHPLIHGSAIMQREDTDFSTRDAQRTL